MGKKSSRSGKSKGSSNKSEGSDRSNTIDPDNADYNIDLEKKDTSKEKKGKFKLSEGIELYNIELYNDDENSVKVTYGNGIDLLPKGLEVNINGDTATVNVDIGLPGKTLGLGGSIDIDLNTGELTGSGSIEGAYNGVSVEVSRERKDDETCYAIKVGYKGVSITYQRCKKDNEDDEKDPKKEPPPPNDDEIPPPSIPPIPKLPGKPGDIITCLFVSSSQSYLYDKSWSITFSAMYSLHIYQGSNSWLISDSDQVGRPTELTYIIDPTTDTYGDGSIVWSDGSYPGDRLVYQVEPDWFVVKEYTDMEKYITDNKLNENIGGYLEGGPYYSWSSMGETEHTWKGYSYIYNRILYAEVNGKPTKLDIDRPEQPDPPIPPRDDMSNCCNLEPVMSLLRKVSKAIGTDELPAMMPKSFLKNEGFRKIPSLAELSVYHLESMDQLIGKFPIELEIVDTDPLTPGDQNKKVVLSNIAETLAELFGLAINSASDSAIQTSGSIKNLLEITLVRQAVLQNYYRLDAILDYLGAGLEEDEATFNSTISLPKDPNNISEDVAEFLQQSEIKFVIDKLADPKNNLPAKLLPIQKAADIIKAKYWKGFGKAGGDYTGAIKDWLKTYDPKNEQNDTDWKDKIDKILEEYAKDTTGNIDKDRMPTIQNITQIGSEPAPPPPGV